MSWIRIFIIQCFYTIVLFFGLDYVNTNYLRFGINNESLYRVSHNIYHHSLRPSFEGIGSWGGNTYRACTDGNGFKSDCDSIQTSQSNFDVAFIVVPWCLITLLDATEYEPTNAVAARCLLLLLNDIAAKNSKDILTTQQ